MENDDHVLTEESLQMHEDMVRRNKDQFYIKNASQILQIGTPEKINYLQRAIERHVSKKFGWGYGHHFTDAND